MSVRTLSDLAQWTIFANMATNAASSNYTLTSGTATTAGSLRVTLPIGSRSTDVGLDLERLANYPPPDYTEECFGIIRQHVKRAGIDPVFLDDGVAALVNEVLQLRVLQAEVEKSRPPREFNKYVNASDLLQEFIGFLAQHKVKRSEFGVLPVELFVKWLIVRACEEDREEPNVQLQIPKRTRARCLGCQRFMLRAPAPFHDARCAQFYYRRKTSAPQPLPQQTQGSVVWNG